MLVASQRAASHTFFTLVEGRFGGRNTKGEREKEREREREREKEREGEREPVRVRELWSGAK